MKAERIGGTRHIVRFENPGDPVPDGDGGFIEGWTPTDPPSWPMSIRPASTRDLESVASGTVVAQATHILTGRYHPQVTTESRVRFKDRLFEISDLSNIDETDLEMQLFCKERVGTTMMQATQQPKPPSQPSPSPSPTPGPTTPTPGPTPPTPQIEW